jgi:translation initiation factor 6 (eIF-6)
MATKKATLTQAKELGEKLAAISVDVTANDRQACINKKLAGRTTISNLLNGTVRNVDTGMKVYNFLKNRIDKRAQALA